MVRIGVNGALGRMGQRILALAKESSGRFETAGAFDEKQPISLSGKGVLIDFSSPEGTLLSAQAASRAGWGLVVGTTGLTDKEREALKSASASIPVVVSSNMGVGINFLLGILGLVKKLPDDYDIRITEAHHIHKKDAPSGTALMLFDAIAKAKNWDTARAEKEKKKIRSIREGEIVGDHSVLFKGLAETVEIKHHAESRDVFAKGALVAAQFVSKKSNGLFTMRDVLGL